MSEFDFSHLAGGDSTAATQTPQTKQAADPNFDFTNLAPQDEFDKRRAEFESWRDNLYNSFGIGHGAVRGILNTIPDFVMNMYSLADHPSERADARQQYGAAISDIGSKLIVNPFAKQGIVKEYKDFYGELYGLGKGTVEYGVSLATTAAELMSNQPTDGKLPANPIYEDAVEPRTGQHYRRLVNPVELMPEEREAKATYLTANVAGLAIGSAAAKATEAALVGQEAIVGTRGLKAISTAVETAQKAGIISADRVAGDVVSKSMEKLSVVDLLNLSKSATTPEFMRHFAAGAAGGGAGGFATGFMSPGTPSDRLAAGVSYAMLALPIGLAMEGLGAAIKSKQIGDMPSMIAEQATAIAKLRQMNGAIDRPPVATVLDMNNLAETGDLAVALVKHHIEYTTAGVDKDGTLMVYGRNAAVVPGVKDPMAAMKAISDHNAAVAEVAPADASKIVTGGEAPSPKIGSKWMGVLHQTKDGLFDILVAPGDTPKPTQEFFAKTGFMDGQQVGYGGNDHFVIEKASVPEPYTKTVSKTDETGAVTTKDITIKPRQYRMTLRNIITDERIEGVIPRDIVRPSSNAPGDLAVYQGRLLGSPSEVFEPSLGLSQGNNGIDVNDPKSYFYKTMHEPNAFNREVNSTTSATIGYQLVKKGNDYYVAGKKLVPGINDIQVTNAENPSRSYYAPEDAGLKSGVVIYMGGKMHEVTNMVDGKPVESQVMIGTPGQPMHVLDWAEVRGRNGVVKRGSHNWWSLMTEPNRQYAGQEMGKYRMQNLELTQSHSTLSPNGGASAMMRYRNAFAPIKIRNFFTSVTPEVLRSEMMQAFVDFIGLRGNEVNPPDIGIGYERPLNNIKGLKGDTRESLLNRLDPNIPEHSIGSRSYFDENGRALTEAEAAEIIRTQVENGEAPTITRDRGLVIDRSQMTMNDLFNAFAKEYSVRPEMAPTVKNFIVNKIGDILLGRDKTIIKAKDNSSLPWLTERIGEIDKQLPDLTTEISKAQEMLKKNQDEVKTMLDNPALANQVDRRNGYIKDLTDEIAEQEQLHKKLTDTREVFQMRIDQLKEQQTPSFSPEELNAFERIYNEAKQERMRIAGDMIHSANANGMYVNYNEGAVVLHDSNTGVRIRAFNTEEAAHEFINKTGRATGVDLDNGNNNLVPPTSVAGGILTPPPQSPRAFEAPFAFPPNGKMASFFNLMSASLPWYTTKRAFFVAMDNAFGTRLYSDVYLPLQMAKMRVEALKRPFFESLKEIEGLLEKSGLDRNQWKKLSMYRETMSPQEVIAGAIKGRPLTEFEINAAHKLNNDNVDIQRVFDFRRSLKEARDEYAATAGPLMAKLQEDPSQAAVLQPKIDELKQQLADNINGMHQSYAMDKVHLEAVDLFDKIQKMHINDASLYGVSRLARALQNNEQSRPNFALANKLDPRHVAIANKIDALYSAVAKATDVDESLGAYLNHFRAYGDIPDQLGATFSDRSLAAKTTRTAQLASELVRTGEMGVYEMDPIRALVSYINSTFNDKHFNDAWTSAKNAAVESLNKIPRGRESATRVTGEYIFGMKGQPAAHDKLMQASVDAFLDHAGIKVDVDVRKDLVNTFIAANSAAYMGFRPAQAARDFTAFGKIYASRFGFARLANAYKLAFTRDANGQLPIQQLAREGKIPGLSFLAFASEEELANSMAGKARKSLSDAFMKTADVGMRASGQHNVYALNHAMAYLDTRELAQAQLLKLSRGEITKAQAYKTLTMNQYDLPVAQGFDRLVSAGKMDEAVEYLAQSTGAEVAFIYGLANHPYGWGSNVGRIASHLGTWSIWSRNFITRLASRGTAGERAAAMARFAMLEGATHVAGRAMGFNLRSWQLLPGIVFMGGPAIQMAQQMEQAVGNRGKTQQDLALSQLGKFGINFAGNFIPGSYALKDYFTAYKLSQSRYGVVPVLGKGLGFSVDQTQRSFLDVLQGNDPQLKTR